MARTRGSDDHPVRPRSPACARARARARRERASLAQVLVRRGLGDAGRGARLAGGRGAPRPALLRRASTTPSALVLAPRRAAARGSSSTATTTSTASASTAILVRALRDARRRRRLVPARAARRTATGCRAATVERLAARGTRLADHRRLRDHRRRGGRARARAAASTSSSPTTTSRAPTACCPTRRSSTRRVGGYPCPDLCAAGVAYKLARRAARRRRPRPRRAPTSDLDLVALATVADCVPLRGENRAPRARRAASRSRATRSPGLRALMRVAQVDPARVDARASASGSRRGSTPPGRLHRADAGVELLLTERRRARRARSPRSSTRQRRAPPRRDAHPVRGRGAGRRARRAPGLRARRRGLAPGRDRDRRLAHRRAPPPPVRAGRARRRRGAPARGARSRPSTCSAGSTRAPSTWLRHGGPPRGGRLHDRARRASTAFRAAFEAHAAAVLRPEDLVPVERVDAVVAGDELGLDAGRGARALAPVRHGQPGGLAARPGRPAARRAADGGGQARALHASRPAAARARAVAFGRTRCPTAHEDAARRDVRARASTVERRRRAAAGPAPARWRREPGRRSSSLGEPRTMSTPRCAELDAAVAVSRRAPAPTAGPDPRRRVRDRRGRRLRRDARRARARRAAACSSSRPARSARGAGLAGRIGGFALCSLGRARSAHPELVDEFDHVVALDPPRPPSARRAAARAGPRLDGPSGLGGA